jgi:hypothetical protein
VIDALGLRRGLSIVRAAGWALRVCDDADVGVARPKMRSKRCRTSPAREAAIVQS